MSGESGTSGLVASSTRPYKAPARGEREWVHPSELPSFEKLRTHQIWPIKSRAARAVAALMAVALVVGSVALYLTQSSNPPRHRTSPRPSANSIELSEGRGRHGGPLDLDAGPRRRRGRDGASHNLAVTTTQIPADALITGSTPGDVNFPVHWVGVTR